MRTDMACWRGYLLFLLVIAVTCILSTGKEDYKIAILIPEQLDVSEDLSLSAYESSYDFNLTLIHIALPESTEDVLKLRGRLGTYQDYLAVITFDGCNKALSHVMSGIDLVTLFRINTDPLCRIQTPEVSGIVHLPQGRGFQEVLGSLLGYLGVSRISIIYDDSMSYYAQQVTAYCQSNLIQMQTMKLNMDAVKEEVAEVVRASRDLEEEVTTSVVLCNKDNTLKLMNESQWSTWNSPDVELRQKLYDSRWLFICEDQGCASDVQSALEEAPQARLALLQINASHHMILLDRLHRLSKSSPQHKHCEWYKLHTVHWDEGQPFLHPARLCKQTTNGALVKMDPLPHCDMGLNGRKLRVYTMTSSPFVMHNISEDGTLNYYGICIDLLKELGKILNFTYELDRPDDLQFGVMNPDGNWTGLVGLLQRKEADLVVASLSVTRARDTVMDFVNYFFEYGGVLMRKPDENEDKWRVIIQPFSWPVWLCILFSVPFAGLAAAGITALAWLVSERQVEDRFRFPQHSTWYTFGTILTQGGYLVPRHFASRNFICAWWGFSIVIVATYGGSLIAYLTISDDSAPFSSLEEMVKQDRYKWGTKGGSVYVSEFKAATGGIKKTIYDKMVKFNQSDPSIFSRSSQEQYNKVRAGDYAFIQDRTPSLVEAISDASCSLVLMKEGFLPMPFGIGLQEGSPYIKEFEKGVMQLRQSGLIDYWQQLWYPKVACSGIPIPESHAITLLDTQSAFYLLLVGVITACLVLAAEQAYRWRCRRRKCSTKQLRHQNGAVMMSSKGHSGMNGTVPHDTRRDMFKGDFSQTFASMETWFQ